MSGVVELICDLSRAIDLTAPRVSIPGVSIPVLGVALAVVLMNAVWSSSCGRQLVGNYLSSRTKILHSGVASGQIQQTTKPDKTLLPARWICFLASFIPGILVAVTAILGDVAKFSSSNCVAAECVTSIVGGTNLLAITAVSSLAWLVFWIDTQVLKIPNQLTILLTFEVLLFVLPPAIWSNFGQALFHWQTIDWQIPVDTDLLVLVGGAILWVLILMVGGQRVGRGDLKLAPALGVLSASSDAKGIVSGLMVTAIAGVVNLPLKLRAIPYGPPLVIGALFGALM